MARRDREQHVGDARQTYGGPASNSNSNSWPSATVLVIDDDSSVLVLLMATLTCEGLAVHTAATGPEGIEVARRVRPDIVVCEVRLSGMDGFDVLRRLRGTDIDAPVVFLSAGTELRNRIAGLSVGGEDYLTKPFRVEEVVTRLRVILRRTRRGTGSCAAHRQGDGGVVVNS